MTIRKEDLTPAQFEAVIEWFTEEYLSEVFYPSWQECPEYELDAWIASNVTQDDVDNM